MVVRRAIEQDAIIWYLLCIGLCEWNRHCGSSRPWYSTLCSCQRYLFCFYLKTDQTHFFICFDYSMKQDGEIWRLNPCVHLHWLSWDEDYIVFNAASGQTHVLNELGAAILRLLEENALNSMAIGQQIVAQYEELVLDTELSEAIENLLENLDILGLIESFPKCA